MPDRHPAVAHLLAAHAEAEQLAGEATKGPWFANRHDWDPCDDFEADIGTRPDGPGVADAAADIVGHGHEGGGVVNLADAVFIAANHPDAVLLRVAEERNILAEHPRHGIDQECARCVTWDGDDEGDLCATPEPWPCRTVLGLAKAWGWKEPTGG